MKTLTDHVVAYQQTGRGFAELRDSILLRAYWFPAPSRGFDDDDRGEFVLFFCPMVHRVLNRFQPQGPPFEAFLKAYFRYQLRSYLRARAQKRLRIRLTWAHDTGTGLHAAAAAEIAERPSLALPTYGRRGRHHEPDPRRPVPRRCSLRIDGRMPAPHSRLSRGEVQRLLLAALKSCDSLDDAAIRRFAAATGFDAEWIIDKSTVLRSLCSGQRLRREMLRNRRDRAWFAAECAREEIRSFASDSRRKLLAERVERLDRTAQRARTELRHSGRGPTNAQIASVVGIRKGTVDSSIFHIRREATEQSLRERLEASALDAYDVPHAASPGYQQPAQATRVLADASAT